MPRTLTAPETAALGDDVTGYAAHARSHFRLEIEDSAGVYQDLTDVLIGYTLRTDVDSTVISGTFRLARWHTEAVNSLSPLITDAIDAGRGIRLYMTTLLTTAGVPAPADLRLKFDGVIDRFDAGTQVVELFCRDRIGALMADHEMLQDEVFTAVPGGIEWGALLNDIMIRILSRAYTGQFVDPLIVSDFDDTGVTVLTFDPANPFNRQPTITVSATKLLEVMRDGAGRLGYQIRPRYNEVDAEFQLAMYAPPHDKVNADWYIPKSRYLVIPRLARDRADIRNAVRVLYVDEDKELQSYPASGSVTPEQAVPLTDAASVAKYGYRFAQFVEDEQSPIRDAATAQQFAELFLADMAEPNVDLEVEVLMNWAVDLDDLIQLQANDDHFSTDQKFFVVGYEHRMDAHEERTILQLRGKPTGGVVKWRRRRIPTPADPTQIHALFLKEIARNATGYTVEVERGTGIWKVAYWLVLDEYPMDAALADDLGAPTGILSAGDDGQIFIPNPPQLHVRWLRLTGYDSSGVPRRTLDVPFDPVRQTIATFEQTTLTETESLGTLGVTVRNPSGLPWELWVQKRIGAGAMSTETLAASGTGTGQEVLETVDIVSRNHRSIIRFLPFCTLDGHEVALEPIEAHFDLGYEANAAIVGHEVIGNRLWLTLSADPDARSSGIVFVGKVSSGLPPADPTLADNDFEISDSRFGTFDTGVDLSNPGANQSIITYVKVSAIDPAGNPGPASMKKFLRSGVAPPAVTINSFTQSKVQSGTSCGDPAESSVSFNVTKGGTDTVTIERHVDGVLDSVILTDSASSSGTVPDTHDFWEQGGFGGTEKFVLYHIIIEDAGSNVLLDGWTTGATFSDVAECP